MDALQKDREILRRLGSEYRSCAELPARRENLRLWKALNALKPERPLVLIDQLFHVLWTFYQNDIVVDDKARNAGTMLFTNFLTFFCSIADL